MADDRHVGQSAAGDAALRDRDLSRTALFLDFDGTLVEIAETPTSIEVPDGLGDLLNRVRDRLDGALAIVSGRMSSDITRFLPHYEGDFAASHGAERRMAGKEERHELAGSDEVAELQREAEAFARQDAALIVETKPVGVVLHFRRKPDLEPQTKEFVARLCAEHPRFKVQTAKMAYEIKPADTGKVGVVSALMERSPYAGRFPVYLGDDDTDEPAMAWADEAGGAGVKVGEGETQARHRLQGVEDVVRLLQHWAEKED